MKKILNKLGHAIMLYLSMLMPRSRKIYVFGAWFGKKFEDNPKYAFLSGIECEGIRCIWVSKNQEVVQKLVSDGFEAYLDSSIKGMFYQLRAKYIFTCTSKDDVNQFLIGNAYIVDLWHGLPLKKFGLDDNITEYTTKNKYRLSRFFKHLPHRKKFVLSSSPTISEIYKHAFGVNEYQIIEWGQPRNDVFYREFSNDPEKDVFVDEKIILYMPTHRNEGRTRFNLEEVLDLEGINKLCKDKGYTFVIRKHFYHNQEEKLGNKYSNIIEITGEKIDAQRLLKSAKVLITDYSSCYIDYLLLNRPLVFYYFDLDNYLLNDRGMYFKYDDVTPGFKSNNFADIMQYLENYIISGVDKFELERNKVRDIFYSEVTRKAVGTDIIEFVKNKGLEKLRKTKQKYR